MATVAKVMEASLKNIIVAASESQINDNDAADFMFNMNMFMNSLAADGINLGYTDVSTVNAEVTIPSGALLGLVKNMAIISAPDYGATVTPALSREAANGLRVMNNIGITITPSRLPGNLPIGSGNEGDGQFRNSHYYADEEALILAQASGPIALETGTTST